MALLKPSIILSKALEQQIAEKGITQEAFEAQLQAAFEVMRNIFGASPADGDWLNLDGTDYNIAARTFVMEGKSGGPELWLRVDTAPE